MDIIIDKKMTWAKQNPLKHRTNGQKSREKRIKVAIAKNAAASRRSLIHTDPVIFDAGWCVKFSFPYSWAASKNRSFRIAASGRPFKIKELKQYQDALALCVASAVRGQKVYKNKIWVEFFVQKPSHKSDAINIVDTVCDAIKIGLGVDDRWFSIKQLDWQITKTDPQIYISIYQRDPYDASACSWCGEILPLTAFKEAKSAKSGISSVCAECQKTV